MQIDLNINVNINKKLSNVNQAISTPLTAGQVGTVTVIPTTNILATINSLLVYIPKIATSGGSGTHSLSLYDNFTGSYGPLLTISAPYTSDLGITGFNITGTAVPSDMGALVAILQNHHFDNTNYLYISYTNSSSLTQSNTRTYLVQFLNTVETSF